MATFVLEVLAEEIPANALPGAREQLEGGFRGRLEEAALTVDSLQAFSTSRRLVVRADGLPERQPELAERVTGPPAAVAFDADGRPTRAAEGFARKVGVEVDELRREATDKGEYVVATVTRGGRPAAAILADLVPAVIADLRFPKMMRWGSGEHEFVRPVHGVVALLDGEVVELELFGVAAGRAMTGHRVHSPSSFELAHADDYAAELRRRHVLVVPEERHATFVSRAAELVADVGCRVVPDPGLVAEHVELVEYPGLLLGSFDPSFLELPREVVVTALRHHQKCLVLERADGALAPHFLAVVDRRDDPEGLVRQGNEWVISARLADARFFFDEDRKRPLDELVPGLERVEFHRTLGSVAAKAERVGALAVRLAGRVGAALEQAAVRRTARLVKADLMSHMVGEFPELQGVMGGHYLRLAGEAEELWTAARDHYQPQGFDGALPASELGRLVAVADRLDTLTGLFAVGEVPSGSRDPFGLRRAAQGAVRIIAESDWPLDIDDALADAAAVAEASIPADRRAATDEVRGFVADRVRRYLVEIGGVRADTADAVMATGWSRLPDAVERARALETARARAEFRALSLAFKRVRNITDDQPDGELDRGLFSEAAEEALDREVERFRERLDACLDDRRYAAAFDAMADLAEVLDRFFVEVLVMTDDERVRGNRVALLKRLGRDFLTLADLSKLQIEGSAE